MARVRMNFKQLENLVSQGESAFLEFKTSTSQLKPAFETVCAFLNGKGGIVLLGVKNKGEIIGQDVTDNTRQEIARELKKIESPVLAHVDVYYLKTVQEKSVIVLDVTAGDHAPYIYEGRPFERIQSTTSLMPQNRYEQLLVRRGYLNHAWEGHLAEECDLAGLDQEEILRTIKEGVDQNRVSVEVLNYDLKRILNNLNLMKDGKLINAAAVLFAKDVEKNYSHCMIRMARFRGIDKLGDFLDNQRVYGNAFRLIEAATHFIQRHLPIASFFEPGRMQRTDQPAVPMLALREALINAISHRDYSRRIATISLAIYDDRLEIWNNGPLAPELKLEDLKKEHDSYPRNKIIASVFYTRGWVESWGTGTTRMAGYCTRNGTPEPEFEEHSGGFVIRFRFKEPMGGSQIKDVQEKGLDLSIRQQKILEILADGALLSAKEIREKLDMDVSSRAIQMDLNILKNNGHVQQVGISVASSWRKNGDK